MTNSARLAWVAGLVEGEGWFGIRDGARPTVVVVSTDADVVNRLCNWTGVGNVTGPHAPGKGSTKQTYKWCVTKREDAGELLVSLVPWLCKRRAARAEEIIAQWRSAPPKRGTATECSFGHELTEENTSWVMSDGYRKRRCRQCVNRRMRETRTRKRQAAT